MHKPWTESVGEEVVSLNLTPSDERIVCMKFDSYIKICCRNELRNIEKYDKRICSREVSKSTLIENKSENTMKEIIVPDFIIKGYGIVIDDEVLFEALEMLKPMERELILLIFHMGYKPRDLNTELKVAVKTVYNRQERILAKLKKLMEENV